MSALHTAKEHFAKCVEANDLAGLQELKTILSGVVAEEKVEHFISEQTEYWPRIQARAAERREEDRQRKLDEPRERELEKLYANRKSLMPDEPIALVLKPNLWRVVVADDVAHPRQIRAITVKGPASARGAIDAALHTDGFEDFKKEFPLCGIAKIEFLGILDN